MAEGKIAPPRRPVKRKARLAMHEVHSKTRPMPDTQESGFWAVIQLPHDVFAATVLPGGARMVIANRAGVFELEQNNAPHPLAIELPEREYNIDRLHHDTSGAVYYSSRDSNRLCRLPGGETSFHTVIPQLSDEPGGQDTIRGFAQSADGRMFIGRYSRKGPARLLTSVDGEDWTVCREWNARHVHDVRINPATGWLYVVVGEGSPVRSEDSHALWRSQDGGASFHKVYRAAKTRPLFLPINFSNDRVILGTDHPGGHNYVCSMIDRGGDALEAMDWLFRIPETPGMPPVQPFAYFLEWMNDTLFLGTRGTGYAALYASSDLKTWHLVQATSALNGNGVNLSSCSNAVRGGPLIVSGMPGFKIVSWSEELAQGALLDFPDTPPPPWLNHDQ